MADNEKQADNSKTPRRPDILRAKDIIPGADNPAGKGNGVSNTDIPRFNLADDIMAEHRRLIAGRRKGPGSTIPVNPPAITQTTPAIPAISKYGFSNGFNTESDPIIADIVARDIERFCRDIQF